MTPTPVGFGRKFIKEGRRLKHRKVQEKILL